MCFTKLLNLRIEILIDERLSIRTELQRNNLCRKSRDFHRGGQRPVDSFLVDFRRDDTGERSVMDGGRAFWLNLFLRNRNGFLWKFLHGAFLAFRQEFEFAERHGNVAAEARQMPAEHLWRTETEQIAVDAKACLRLQPTGTERDAHENLPFFMRNIRRDGIKSRLFKRKFIVCPLTRIPDIDGELIIVVRLCDLRAHGAFITAHVDGFTRLKFRIRNAENNLHGIVVVGHHLIARPAKRFRIACLRFKTSRHHIQIVVIIKQTEFRLLRRDGGASFWKQTPYDGGILPSLLFHDVLQRRRIGCEGNGNTWHGGVYRKHGHGGDGQ